PQPFPRAHVLEDAAILTPHVVRFALAPIVESVVYRLFAVGIVEGNPALWVERDCPAPKLLVLLVGGAHPDVAAAAERVQSPIDERVLVLRFYDGQNLVAIQAKLHGLLPITAAPRVAHRP